MKAIKIISGIMFVAPLAAFVAGGILAINILGWMNGAVGGLGYSDFMLMLWTCIILSITSTIWWCLIGLLIKKSPIYCYRVVYHKVMNKFVKLMED